MQSSMISPDRLIAVILHRMWIDGTEFNVVEEGESPPSK